MKLITYKKDDRSSVGAIVEENLIIDLNESYSLLAEYTGESNPSLPQASLIEILETDEGLLRAGEAIDFVRENITNDEGAATRIYSDLSAVTLLPPVVRPTKVIGAGMNFRSFVSELGESPPSYPVLFHKTCSALIGCGSSVVVPPITDQAVPEGELALIIGKRGKFIEAANYEQHIAGYTCGNDISARDLEFRTSQWTSGKMLETFCPLGPALVTPDEITDPNLLYIQTLLNGRTVQHGKASDMIFTVADLIAEISSVVTLEVGDVILTGTPSDLGESDPPIFLQHGDIITVKIEGVGFLQNIVQWSQRKPAFRTP